MKIIFNIAILLFTINTPYFSSPANAEDDPIDRATFFVLRMDSQADALFELSKPIGKDTEPYRLMVKAVGEEKADRFLFAGFLEVQLPYREQWERSLAQSYLEVFSVYELNSLLQEAKKSPYFSKFIENRKLIGSNAQVRSEELIKTAALKSIESAYTKFSTSE